MFWLEAFLHFVFSLTIVSIFSMVSSAPEILSSISYIVSVMLTSMTTYLFLRFSISRVDEHLYDALFLDTEWFCSIPPSIWLCCPVIL